MVEFFYISDECRKCAENSDVRFYLLKLLLWYQKVKFSAPIGCASESRRIQPMSSKLWSVKCQEDSCFYIYVTWRVGFSTLWDPQWQQVASSGWQIFPVCYTVGSSDMSQDPVPFRKYFRRDSGTDKLEILLLHTYIFLVLLPTLPDASHHIKTVLKYVCRKKIYLYLRISIF